VLIIALAAVVVVALPFLASNVAEILSP